MVEWLDAVSDNSEITAFEASGLPNVKTYGVILEITEKFIRVAGERLDHTTGSVTYRGVTTIPAPWKLKVLTL